MSIVTCLLHANCKDNLKTTFLQINKIDFKGLFKFIDVAMAMAHMSAKLSSVTNLLAAILGDQRIKDLREKGQ